MVDEPARFDAGIPAGTAALALRLAEEAAAAATRLTGRTHVVDRPAVLAHLLLPLVVGDDPVAAAPRAAPAGGWVHADVLPEDEALLELLTDATADAEALAAAAQECRLPVTPYRRRHGGVGRPSATSHRRCATSSRRRCRCSTSPRCGPDRWRPRSWRRGAPTS